MVSRWVRGATACLWLPLAAICASVPSTFNDTVQPFFARHCYSCHNGRSAAGGLNLQTLNTAASVSENRDEWQKILRRTASGDMPPKSAPRPDAGEVKAVTGWLQNALTTRL